MRQLNSSAPFKLAFVLALLASLLLTPVSASAQENEVVIATWNLEWFFDDDTSDNTSELSLEMSAPSSEEYSDRVVTIADAIAEIDPEVLALQEIENDKVVQDLANHLLAAHNLHYTVAFVQGEDTFTGQDVAFLIKEGVAIEDAGSRFEFTDELDDQDGFRNVSKHLRINVTINGESYTFVTVHLLSSNVTGRQEQARTLRAWITTEVDPAATLVVLGDFNAGQNFNQTSSGSEIGIIRGFQTQAQDDDLFDVHQLLGDRATHVGGKELDRILVDSTIQSRELSVETRPDLSIRAGEDSGCDGVCYSEPVSSQDLSDHFPLVLTIAAAEDDDSVVRDEATTELLLAQVEAIEAKIGELQQEIKEIKQLILALDE